MDRLVSLITNLATGNKDYVAFVGAGFSKDAGIMSGWEELLETLKRLYFLSNNINSDKAASITSQDISDWYTNNPEINGLGYSQILEMIYPGDTERREFVSSLFADKNPGTAHRELAQLVSMGLIRFIFTTNFDDLIEKALDEYGIEYDVIFSDDVLEKSKSWDKVRQCRVYKLHGDYKVGAIKNTDSELQTLDPLIGEDFQYIIDRHGIIFIGYSGRDADIMQHILKRKPFAYPIYWQYKEFPENDNEYEYFYKMKNKYDNIFKRPVFFLSNPSASKFLQSVREGVEKLNLMLTINSGNEKSFDLVVIDSDAKKLRKSSYFIIEKLLDLYKEYKIKEDKDRLFTYKYEVFKELIQESEFLFNYLEALIKYDCDYEVEFLIKNIIKALIIDLNEKYSYPEFIQMTFPYFVIVSCGSLVLKYEKEPLLNVLWNFEVKSYYQESIPIMGILSYEGEGWDYIKKEIYKTNYFYAKYTIIRDHLRLQQLSPYDIDYFDCYIFLSTLLIHTNIRWINGSSMYQDSPFMAIYQKYFKDILHTDAQYEAMMEIYKKNHQYMDVRYTNSFYSFVNTLKTKLNITV